jgi:hypothetical protein
MKAMDRVFDAMGQEQHRTHQPPVVQRYVCCDDAERISVYCVTLKVFTEL